MPPPSLHRSHLEGEEDVFFLKDAATTEIYTLSLHDALPISVVHGLQGRTKIVEIAGLSAPEIQRRSEEHTSELQSRGHLVCRLLLEKKNPPFGHLLPRGEKVGGKALDLPSPLRGSRWRVAPE